MGGFLGRKKDNPRPKGRDYLFSCISELLVEKKATIPQINLLQEKLFLSNPALIRP